MDGTINLNQNSNTEKYSNPYRTSRRRKKTSENSSSFNPNETKIGAIEENPNDSIENDRFNHSEQENITQSNDQERRPVEEQYGEQNLAQNTTQNTTPNQDQSPNPNQVDDSRVDPFMSAHEESIKNDYEGITSKLDPTLQKLDSQVPSQQMPEYDPSQDPKNTAEKEPLGELADSMTDKYYRLYLHWMLLVNFLWYWVGAFLLLFFVYWMSEILVGKMSREPGPIIHLFGIILFWLRIIIIFGAVINLIQRYFKFIKFKYYLGDGKVVVKRYNRLQTINVKWGTYGEVIQKRISLARIFNYGTFRVYDPISKEKFELKYVKEPFRIAALINQDAQFIDKY